MLLGLYALFPGKIYILKVQSRVRSAFNYQFYKTVSLNDQSGQKNPHFELAPRAKLIGPENSGERLNLNFCCLGNEADRSAFR